MAPKKSSTTSDAAATKEKATTPAQTGPIKTVDTTLSNVYKHLHDFALLGVIIQTFPYLVADPINALLASLLPIAVLQGLYSVICLPGTTVAPKKKKSDKKNTETPGISFKVVPSILSLFISLALGAPILTLVMILFGAPFTTMQLQTLLCAAHLALLAGPGLVYSHGVDAAAWIKIAALDVPVDEVFGAALGTLLGAWAGAVPIPLDWDREWQRWPVTVVVGAYGGFVVGKALAGVWEGKRIRLE